MSGLLTAAEYATLVPGSTLASDVLASYLMAAQAITEQLTGLVFGCEITSVTSLGGNQYKLFTGYPLGEPGDKVRLIGNGVASTAFTLVDASQLWIVVESTVSINATKALPICEYVGQPASGYVYVQPLPLFSVESVKTRTSPDQLWSSSDVTTLANTTYEPFTKASGIKAGIFIKSSSLPKQGESAPWLLKSYPTTPRDSIRVEYVAGFYAAVPADLKMAQVEIVTVIQESVSKKGVFASESYDYYSYSRLSFEQMASIPSSALATFRRYAR